MMKKVSAWALKKSPWIYRLNSGACNACDIEVIAALTPRFDPERFGCLLKASPRHADVLVITGPVTMQISDRFKRVYDQVPDPKVVVAVGSCCLTQGVYEGSYSIVGPVDKVIPTDVMVPGCPPRPQAILDGLLRSFSILQEKRSRS